VKAPSEFERRYAAAAARNAWDEACHHLQSGARGGDAFSCAQLGVWHLLGNIVARDDAAGFRLVEMAAWAGEVDAQRLLATLYARGRGVTASWTRAIEWLVRGARAGDPRSMRQLAVLLPGEALAERRMLIDMATRLEDPTAPGAKASGNTLSRNVWRRISSAACRPNLPAREVEVIREAPLIRACRAVLSTELCAYLIRVATPQLVRARVNDPTRGADRIDESRTNSFANFWLLEGDVVTDCVDRMLAQLMGLPYAAGETLSVLHYAPGEQFAPHFDFFDPDTPVHARQITSGGQRIATCLVYLNEAYVAGSTAFVDIDLAVRGATGDALFWNNVDANGTPDRATRHAGLAPSSGEKWLLSKWFRDRPQP
jgi:prolyl 4-hydroxylase